MWLVHTGMMWLVWIMDGVARVHLKNSDFFHTPHACDLHW